MDFLLGSLVITIVGLTPTGVFQLQGHAPIN